jgi:hypothetical protein
MSRGALLRQFRSRGDPVERNEGLPGPSFPLKTQDFAGCPANALAAVSTRRTCDLRLACYEGTTMAYDWTGDATRKRNRQKLGYAILLSAVIILGVPAAIGPFL